MTSTPTLVDERVHAVAVKAALNAWLGAGDPPRRAYDYDEVPGTDQCADEVERENPLPDLYAMVTVERRGGIPVRASGSTGRTGWRITVRSVGSTVDECRWVMWKTSQALNEKRLTIGGVVTTPVQFEPGQSPEWDDKRFSALSLWTYVH